MVFKYIIHHDNNNNWNIKNRLKPSKKFSIINHFQI